MIYADPLPMEVRILRFPLMAVNSNYRSFERSLHFAATDGLD
jgi:hypothetical protein